MAHAPASDTLIPTIAHVEEGPRKAVPARRFFRTIRAKGRRLRLFPQRRCVLFHNSYSRGNGTIAAAVASIGVSEGTLNTSGRSSDSQPRIGGLYGVEPTTGPSPTVSK